MSCIVGQVELHFHRDFARGGRGELHYYHFDFGISSEETHFGKRDSSLRNKFMLSHIKYHFELR